MQQGVKGDEIRNLIKMKENFQDQRGDVVGGGVIDEDMLKSQIMGKE